jgi:hypothetical protein
MYVKRGFVGSSPAVIILNFTHGPWFARSPRQPSPRWPCCRVYTVVIATNYRHHHHIGKGKGNCHIIVPAAFDGTARAWRIPDPRSIIALPGKEIAFCLALRLMGFAPVYPNG